MRTSFFFIRLASCLVLLLLLGACQRAVAPGDPVAAVKAQAEALRDDDVLRFQQLSLPPDLYARQQRAWDAAMADAPPPDPREAERFDRRLQAFITPGAERDLLKRAQPRFKKFSAEIRDNWALMKPTFGLLLDGMLQANRSLDANQRAHLEAAGEALLDGLSPQRLTDPKAFERSIAVMCRSARKLEVANLAEVRALPMEDFYRKLGVVLAGAKDIAALYGVDVQRSFAELEAELVDADGERATVRVRYPLADAMVEFDAEMLRVDGRWYSASAVEQARALPDPQTQPAQAAR